MTAPLTPADLAALRALADKATPGPWRACAWDPMERPHVHKDRPKFPSCSPRGDLPITKEDAAFIAAAREAMPRLLDALEAVTKERDEHFAVRLALDLVRKDRDRQGEARLAAEAERDAARAEVARLRQDATMRDEAATYFKAEADRLRALHAECAANAATVNEAQRAEITQARAEVERLRGALRFMLATLPKQMATVADADRMRPAVTNARTVLGEEGTR